MGFLRKWTGLILFSVSILSCNIVVTVIDEYIAPTQNTIIPEETVIPTSYPTTAPTPDPSSIPYEILFSNGSGSGWFGGDDNAPRNVGNGQSIYFDTNIMITNFSFYFSSKFDYSMYPENIGHTVTIRYTLRDNMGTPVLVQDVNVSSSFSGGWVTWTNINKSVMAGENWIFTAYLLDGYNLMYSSGAEADTGAGFPAGSRYIKTGTTDADMDSWSGWGTHSWDSWFWLQGYTQ